MSSLRNQPVSGVTRPLPSSTQGPKLRKWISIWFLIAAPIILYDAGYCFLRPRSMKGGDLEWIWSPAYDAYQEIDQLYGIKALEHGDGFTNAQALLNVVETFLNLTSVYLSYFTSSPWAIVIALTSAVMTASKTALYFAQEHYCGYCNVGHNDWQGLATWGVPLLFWFLISAVVVIVLGKQISGQFQTNHKGDGKVTVQKRD
ncbi:hypothetical protein HGRIS_014459 [Hohenbuehelia grisea]|uniref:Uncharacterized protein n=1 Tax=Hohenbuehelia grisea TaxID=104357 RepID=A0ABR3JTM1_9AGAR